MRIALVHMRHAHTGGTERYLNLVATDLAQAGHEPVIVCRSHEDPPHPAIDIVSLRPLAIGAAHRMLGFAKAVEAHIKKTPYDLVFGLGKTWTHDVLRMGGGCHATYLELAHDATLSPLERLVKKGAKKHRLALQIEARALGPQTRRVITNSELVRADVRRRYDLDPARVTVIHNGTDTERFHPRLRTTEGAALRKEAGLADHDEVVLFLGTGYGRKGLGDVLDAVAALAPERPRLKLLIVGYDSAAATYAARAAALGITDRCRFLGGRRDAERCFAAADVYVLPTRYDPFANSTLEAMAAGLPVITTPTNGGSELIEPDVSGHVLRTPRDTPDFTRELQDALAHWLDHRESGGLAARTTAEANDAQHMTARTRKLLESLVQSV